MNDQISFYRVGRLSLFPPAVDGGNARYAVLATRVRRGIPNSQILVDGVLPSAPASPTTDELLALFDSALHQSMLF